MFLSGKSVAVGGSSKNNNVTVYHSVCVAVSLTTLKQQ
jgi:hypothetical protein